MKDNDTRTAPDLDTTQDLDEVFSETAHAGSLLPALDPDMAKYLPEMADFDLTEAEKTEFLRALWSIMESFVELGLSAESCEQVLTASGLLPGALADDAMIPPTPHKENHNKDCKED